jgi:diguanylate cyclase (GGDEF)-like protein/PAS domain S-box-containing protein
MHVVEHEGLPYYAGTLEPFINQIPDYALYMLDTSGHVRSWNTGAERLKNYTAQEIIGRHFSVFYTAADVAMNIPAHALDIASREGTYQEEGLRVRKDGKPFWAMVTITALRDKDGKLEGFAKLTRDITERKALEAAQQTAREARYRALYENSHDAIFLTKPTDHTILAANPAACKLFGYPEQELVSMQREQVLNMADVRVAIALAQRAASGEATADLTFIRKGGEKFEARVSSKLFTDEHGQQLSCTTVQDITGKKRAEEALRRSEERFRLLYQNAPLGIIQTDHKLCMTSVNPKFTEITGYSPEDVIGKTYFTITLPDDRATAIEMAGKLRSGEIKTLNLERRMPRKDGGTIWVRLNGTMMPDKQGELQEGLVLIEDITEKKQAEEALLQSEEKFRATFEHAPMGIAECSLDGDRILVANAKLAEILGYAKDELEHLTFTDLTHPADLEKSMASAQKLASGEVTAYAIEKRYVRKDHSIVWANVTVSLAPVRGMPRHVIVTIEDIAARKKVEDDLRRTIEASYHQANHDMLTGLANRASFNDRLKEALAYARRDGHLVALLLLDLDRFKSINDTLGHHVGDLLLQAVATRIKSHVRATDLVVRLGGDEFVVIQTHLAEPDAAAVLAAKLVEDLRRTYVLEGHEVHSGTSIGVAVYPDDAEAPEELVRHADLALYDAKNHGRQNYQFYRQELGAAFHEAQQLEQELARALRESEFFLDYLPQFDLQSGRISGIETLLRWRHPTRGTLAAAAFIQEAERARLMPKLGEWTLHTACRQYKEWIDTGFTAPLTVNLSSPQLRDPHFLQMLTRILEETGVPASLLQLDMRENVLWDPKLSKNLLKQLKASGIRLALDDFCKDMAALATLDRFPLDALKPGQRLIRALPSHKREATILAAIIGIAHDRKITVCADGVETAPQLAAVKEQGCDSAQGYWLSLPLDAAGMKRLIELEEHGKGSA